MLRFLSAAAMIAAVVILLTAGLPDSGDFALDVPAPSFTLPTLDGQLIDLDELRGQTVLINFWATWCAPCAIEMPELQRLHEQNPGLRIIAINEGESREQVRAWVEKFGLTFDVVLDETQVVGALYGLNGMPSTYVISPSGSIVRIFYGPADIGTLRNAISPYLAE